MNCWREDPEFFNAWAEGYLRKNFNFSVEELEKIESPWEKLAELDPEGWCRLGDLATVEWFEKHNHL